jgi:hypothetical protein
MIVRRAWGCVLAAFVLCGATLSCDLSSSILSDADRSSLYAVSLKLDSQALAEGSLIRPGSSINTVVSLMSGASEPATLDLSIVQEAGKRQPLSMRIATPRYLGPNAAALPRASEAQGSSIVEAGGGSAPGAESGAATTLASDAADLRNVSRIEDPLPVFLVPEDIEPGSYRLTATLASVEGKTLQRTDIVVFIGTVEPSLEAASYFPPSVEPGAAVLLSASVELPAAEGTAPPATADPWIRWSREGVAFAEGPLSEGMDRAVWIAPKSEGAYPIEVEAFPAAPPDAAGFAFTSSIHQGLKVIVKGSLGGASDEFADALRFSSLLRFNGSFEDAGTRTRSSQPEAFGKPALELYPDGFGYRFGSGTGVRIDGLLPPATGGKLGAFTVLARVLPQGTDGFLVRFASEDGVFVLDIGLRENRPYAELGADGKTTRSSPLPSATGGQSPALPSGAITLIASFKPEGDKLGLAWIIEGRRFASSPLPLSPQKGYAIMGGAGSLPCIFDDFGLMGQSPLPPAYRYAERRRWKSGLVAAEAFEDGLLPVSATVAGGAKAVRGGVELPTGSSVAFSPAFPLDRPMAIETQLSGDTASASLVLASEGGALMASFLGNGEIHGPTGAKIGDLGIADGRLSFVLKQGQGSIQVFDQDGDLAAALPDGAADSIQLSVRRAGGQGRLALERVFIGPSADKDSKPGN